VDRIAHKGANQPRDESGDADKLCPFENALEESTPPFGLPRIAPDGQKVRTISRHRSACLYFSPEYSLYVRPYMAYLD
jgi:hypothetical protein